MRRSYSICSGPDDGEIRIAVKKVDGGAFSNWAAEDLKCGDESRRDDADRPLRRGPAGRKRACSCRLRRGLRHHADPVDREGGARARAGQPLLPVLRQPQHRQHHVPRSARGAEGPLHRSPLDLPRHLRRGAGHPDPAWPARRRQGEGAAALAGSGGKRRSRLCLRSPWHERGYRDHLPRGSASQKTASTSSASSRNSAASRDRRRWLRPTRRRRRSPR